MWTSCKGAREGGEGVCLSSVDVSNKLKCLHSRHKVGVVMNIINHQLSKQLSNTCCTSLSFTN